ncbi:MAG: hypothetical protein F4Z72_01085 [Gemmatimonadales bacterium]|nr:hypothetical protein [Candidatus Palauibacter irciniicola]MYC19630.1 hypothetical protein [Gemmatimonadales bacterium]
MRERTMHRPLRRTLLSLLLSASGVYALAPEAAWAQEVPVDRWLVTGAEHVAGDHPLPVAGPDRFPDRNLETAAGTWSLFRRDGQATLDFSEFSEGGQATLAHVYLKSPADASVRLELGVEPCTRIEAWLNAQSIADSGTAHEVRLAAGWNTLLVVLDGEPGCERTLSARLSPDTGPNVRARRDDRSGDRLTVQASRPPGVRPAWPAGVVTVSTPRIAGLAWRPDDDDLQAAIRYELASWGREFAAGMDGAGAPGIQRPLVGFRNPFDLPPRSGGAPGEAGEAGEGDDETGPTDPEGMRARMVAQLLGRPEPRAPAPRQGSAELRLADESFVAASSDLEPGVPVSFEGVLPFRKLREAALRDDGMKGEFRWDGGDGEGEGRMPAAPVLRALHGALDLALEAGTDGVWRGRLRVPDVLAGFTLRGEEGSWTVDGSTVEDRLLCDPCERGRRLEVEFRGTAGTDSQPPRARIEGLGFPDLPETGAPSAVELLRALEGDNRRYRALIERPSPDPPLPSAQSVRPNRPSARAPSSAGR